MILSNYLNRTCGWKKITLNERYLYSFDKKIIKYIIKYRLALISYSDLRNQVALTYLQINLTLYLILTT